MIGSLEDRHRSLIVVGDHSGFLVCRETDLLGQPAAVDPRNRLQVVVRVRVDVDDGDEEPSPFGNSHLVVEGRWNIQPLVLVVDAASCERTDDRCCRQVGGIGLGRIRLNRDLERFVNPFGEAVDDAAGAGRIDYKDACAVNRHLAHALRARDRYRDGGRFGWNGARRRGKALRPGRPRLIRRRIAGLDLDRRLIRSPRVSQYNDVLLSHFKFLSDRGPERGVRGP